MGGGSWVVQEGFLLCTRDTGVSARSENTNKASNKPTIGSTKVLTELYVMLTVNRKLEFFDGSDAETRNKVDGAYLLGFSGWDGDGLLKVDSYGLELKIERNAKSRMHLAAFNRVDLNKWCRGFIAVLDPQSAAGLEVRRERRRGKKEEKRLQQAREEQIRKWKEKKARMIREEQDRLLAREEAISNMTPLERIDDIGSLDDNTARMLEKRRQRLQRRQAPTMGRVNKAAYRRRLEEAAGGKTENVQPLHTKLVEQKAKIRVEVPPPGQFFEVGGVVHIDTPVRFGSFESEMSDCSSMSSRLSSVSSLTGSRHETNVGNGTPPPPPPLFRTASSSRTSMSSKPLTGLPPPPPPPTLFDHDSFSNRTARLSRSSSSASLDSFAFSHNDAPLASRASFSQTNNHVLSAAKSHQSREGNLAAILRGGRPNCASRAARTSDRRESFGSTMSSISTASYMLDRKSKMNAPRSIGSASPPATTPTIPNAFAASLATIRRNRANTVEEEGSASEASIAVSSKVRSRQRDSQLSTEGKDCLRNAMAQEVLHNLKPQPHAGRRGLFDGSSSEEDDDSDTGLFGVRARKSKTGKDTASTSVGFRPSDLSVKTRPEMIKMVVSAPSVSSDDIISDSDSNSAESAFSAQSFIKSVAHLTNVAAGGAGPSIMVLFTTSSLRKEGKKSVGVFTFTLQFGNMEHTFSFTYSEFEVIHTRLISAFPGMTLPKFPSKHRLRNNTKPENMEKRAHELRLYVQQLVALPQVLSSEQFQAEYFIEGSFSRALLSGQQPTGRIPNGAPLNGRPPRSPVQSQPRKEHMPAPSSSSQIERPLCQAAKETASKGFDDSISHPESKSDTSVDTLQQVVRQQQRNSAAISTQRRQSQISDNSRSGISLNAEDSQCVKKSRSRSRRSSRASSRTSLTPSLVAPASPVASLTPPGHLNPFAGGRGDLLSAIRQGAQLKKHDATGESPSGVSSAATPLALTQTGSINEAITTAMAMRRIHVEYEEIKSDCGSDSDDDWD